MKDSLEDPEIHTPWRGQHFSLPTMSILFQTHQKGKVVTAKEIEKNFWVQA